MTGDDEQGAEHEQRARDEAGQWAEDLVFRWALDALRYDARERSPSRDEYLAPTWWLDTQQPATVCCWCQRPHVPAVDICNECRQARADANDPSSLLAHWRTVSPLAKRLHLTIATGIDPWTGRRARIGHESATAGEDGFTITRATLGTVVPRTSWDLQPQD